MEKLSISDGLSIGIDVSEDGDVAVMQIVRFTGNKCEVINTLYGEEAIWTYEHLINNQCVFNLDDNKALKELNWMKANPALQNRSMPEFLTKPFHFTGENPMLTHFSLPQKPRRTSPEQMMLIDEMYPSIKLNSEGGTN